MKTTLEKDAVDCEFFVESVKDESSFVEALQRHAADIAILDIHLAEEERGEGISLVQKSRQICPDIVILMRSNSDDAATIGQALRKGADDFISKRSDKGELCLRVLNSYKLARLKVGKVDGVSELRAASRDQYAGETMGAIAVRVPNIVDSAIRAVHVRGETGTGKEVVADTFAANMGERPFLRVNCGAITPTLMESELFGHVKGAFTGANVDKIGYLQHASSGWIFLDEVSSLSLTAQAALLRVIENQEVSRVGETKTRKIDVRILSATNDDLTEMVEAGTFRQDLWMRLREKVIELPPLRERRDEIPQLIHHFCKTMDGGPYRASPSVIEVLSAASWRAGNIRELRNCLRAMTEYDADKVLTPIAIPKRVWEELGEQPSAGDESTATENGLEISVNLAWHGGESESFDVVTDRLLLQLIRLVAARSKKVSMRSLSREIGIPRTTLSERLKRIVHQGQATSDELATLIGSYKPTT